MTNGYYEANTCYYMSSRKHRRILRRIRSACEIIIGVCLLMMVGIVGSAEVGDTTLAQFFVYETINISILLLAAWVRTNI